MGRRQRHWFMPPSPVGGFGGAAAADPILSGSICEYQFLADGGQVVADVYGNYDAQLGTTSGADANDPTWNASGWYDYGGLEDLIEAPAGLSTALGTGAQSIVVVFEARAYNYIGVAFPANTQGLLINGDGGGRAHRVQANGSTTEIAKAAKAFSEAWQFLAGIYSPSGAENRVSNWTASGVDALAEVEATGTVPASLTQATEYYIGNVATLNRSINKIAFIAFINSAISDTDITNTIYPAVKTFVATKGITLP